MYVPSGGIKPLEVKICPEAGKAMFRPGLEDREVPEMRSPTIPLCVTKPLDYVHSPLWFLAMHQFLKKVQFCELHNGELRCRSSVSVGYDGR